MILMSGTFFFGQPVLLAPFFCLLADEATDEIKGFHSFPKELSFFSYALLTLILFLCELPSGPFGREIKRLADTLFFVDQLLDCQGLTPVQCSDWQQDAEWVGDPINSCSY